MVEVACALGARGSIRRQLSFFCRICCFLLCTAVCSASGFRRDIICHTYTWFYVVSMCVQCTPVYVRTVHRRRLNRRKKCCRNGPCYSRNGACFHGNSATGFLVEQWLWIIAPLQCITHHTPPIRMCQSMNMSLPTMVYHFVNVHWRSAFVLSLKSRLTD